MDDRDKIMERIRRLERFSHPPVKWEEKIKALSEKVKSLSKLITKEIKNAK